MRLPRYWIKYVAFIALICRFLPYSSYASAKSLENMGSGGHASTLSYGLDTSLTYVDAIQGIKVSNAIGQPLLTDSNLGSNPRVLGLGRMRAVLDWQTTHAANFRLVLRPDAVSRKDEAGTDFIAREFDTRSGDSGMKPLPTIRLVDAYQMNLPIAENLSGAVGVFESFRAVRTAYKPVLGFGLDVIMPAKFNGVALDWSSANTALPTASQPAPQIAPPEFTAQIYYLLGDQDRGELISAHSGSYDAGPSARDPYQGGAMSLSWRLGEALEMSGVGGYLRAAELGGAFDSVFGQVTILGHFNALNQHHRLSFDGRYEKDHGRNGVAPQNLISGDLSLAWGVSPSSAVLLGFRAGRGTRWAAFTSQRASTVNLRGYQMEAGYQGHFDENLALSVLASQEFRLMGRGDQDLGGFQDADGSKKMIHRVALELTYSLNSNS